MTEATEVIRINSVSIEDNSRGTTAAVKAYGLTLQEAEDEAVASIQRLRWRLKAISQVQVLAPTMLALLRDLARYYDDPLYRADKDAEAERATAGNVAYLEALSAQAADVVALADGQQA